ncbi:unnamed protein product [Dibothriocephalus latus]|uniref:Fucosyltransferase n=1 Tax=Dibothriocephalus latus TaxID=60516 RepID=A0A3P6U691_DIBLA|nr:unnamed protein product [Dibothriocephalus latus]
MTTIDRGQHLILAFLLLIFYVFFNSTYANLVQYAVLSPIVEVLPVNFHRSLPALHEIILEDDFRQAQQEEWRKPPAERHCPSGTFYPLLRAFNQNAAFTLSGKRANTFYSMILRFRLNTVLPSQTANVEGPAAAETAPLIFIDRRFYFPFESQENCRHPCRITTDLQQAHNASAAVFTRTPTAAMARILKGAVWAFHSMESPLRMHEVHPDYKNNVSSLFHSCLAFIIIDIIIIFFFFLTIIINNIMIAATPTLIITITLYLFCPPTLLHNPNSTIPSVYGAFEAFNQPECLIGDDIRRQMMLRDNRKWLPPNFKQKRKLIAWLVSNMNAENRRKEVAARLRRWVPVDIYGLHRLPCPGGNCHEKLGQIYKFYLAFENSNCRGYLTEKLFTDALRAGMVPIVMGGSPEDYYSIAPPNSYIHVSQFSTIGKLAEYIRYLDQNDTAYSAYFAWKALGTLKVNS